MSDKIWIKAKESISQLGDYGSSVLASIDNLNQAAAVAQNSAQNLQSAAQKNLKKCKQLKEVNACLERQLKLIEPSAFLSNMLENKEKVTEEQTHAIGRKEELRLPKVEVPDLEWAVRYLEEIKEQNFESGRALALRQRENISVLMNNLKRYSVRLSETEQKLKKCYEEARSKKRFI